MNRSVWFGVVGILLAGCAEEPLPRTAEYFMDNRIALDGAMVRCNADRERTIGDPECINARRAVARLGKIQEEDARKQREAEFERKRADYRVRRAMDEQRRRQAEEQRLRAEEAAREAAAYGIVDGQVVQPPPDDRIGSVEPYPDAASDYATDFTQAPVEDTSAPAPADPLSAEDGMSQSDIQSEILLLEEELRRRREAQASGETEIPESGF